MRDAISTKYKTIASPRHRQRGQSLIDYVIYLALAILVIAGIVYYASAGNQTSNVQAETENNAFIVSSARKLYSGSATGFESVTAANLINNGAVPTTEVTGTTITSAFGTPVTVAAGTLYNADDSMILTYLVPPASCSSFVSSVQPTYAKVTVAGTTIKDTTVGTTFAQATLGTACAASNGASISVVLYASR